MNGIRTKSLNNHFTRYSDIKVKPEKRPTFSDSNYDEKRFDLYEMGMFALQLSSLIVNESQMEKKLREIHTGLLKYCDDVTNSGCDLDPWEVKVGEGCLAANGMSSKYDKQSTLAVSTGVPTNSITHKFGFIKKPYVVRGAVSTDIHTVPSVRLANLNGTQLCHENSLTSKERERLRFRDALLRVDEKIQANMQRCKVAQDVLDDSKKTMIRTLQARELALKVVEGGRIKQKMPNKSNGTSSSSRTKKKKGL